jgi:hypothetical protein
VHNANLASWRSTFVTANPFPAKGTDNATWLVNLKAFRARFVPTLAQINNLIAGTDATEANYLTITKEFFDELIVKSQLNLLTATEDLLKLETMPATDALYNAAKADYEANITLHVPLLTPATTELKVGADGFFEISRPRANTLDTRTVAFDIKVTNLQSPANPLAANSNSYLRLATAGANTKSELLTFVKSGTGAGTIPNNAAVNTANTKVALELASANPATTVNVIDTSVTTKFTYIPGLLNSVTLNDVFTQEVSFLSVAGNYNYNFAIGSLSEAIKVRVIDPVVKVDFDVTSTAFVKGTDGIFYATENKNASGVLQDLTATLDLELLNFAAAASTPFSFTLDYPKFVETQTNAATTTDIAGNDGNSSFAPLLTQIYTRANTLTTLGSTSGLSFKEKGTYKISITVGGVTETLTFVVREFPSVKVNSVTVADVAAPLFDETYLFKGVASATLVKFNVEAVALPETVYAKVVPAADHSTTILETNATGKTELKLTAGNGVIEHTFTPAQAGAALSVTTTFHIVLFTKNASDAYKFVGFSVVKLGNVDLP